MVGIISNTAALQAQRNLEISNTQTQSSIGKLSSGKRIIKASDDVAGLAVGTILQSGVTTLKAAMTNAAQAATMLGMADGGLDNIGQMLQRQNALAAQAAAGSLDDVSRGYLDQEFQNLKKEIGRIADNSNFNGIKLLDGSIAGGGELSASTKTTGIAASSTLSIATAAAADDDATLAFSDIETGQTATFTFVDAEDLLGDDTDLLDINVDADTSAANQRDELLNKINMIMDYSGTNTTVLAAKGALATLSFTSSGTADLVITSRSVGASSDVTITGAGWNAAADVTLGGANVGAAGLELGSGTGTDGSAGAVMKKGNLYAGIAETSLTAYIGAAPAAASRGGTTVARGEVGDTILRGKTAAIATTGIATHNISNNPDFVGNIQGFKATYVAPNVVDLEVKVGNFTYGVQGLSSNYAANQIVSLYSMGEDTTSQYVNGGSIQVQFAAGTGETVNTQDAADVFAERMDSAFSSLNFYQRRVIDSYKGYSTIYPDGSTTANGSLTGSYAAFYSDSFDEMNVTDIRVKHSANGNAQIEFDINGDTYVSGYDGTGTAASLGNTITDAGAQGTTIGFVSAADSNKLLTWTNDGGSTISLTTEAEAAGFEKALKKAFGIGGDSGGLSFQVGVDNSDSIGVKIGGARDIDIYKNDNNTFVDVAIGTEAGAAEASAVVKNAITKVSTIRANIGALMSRFDFAQATISSGIANQDAARGVFLDADIAAESTNLAQAQVRLQASISVLAQANQIPQTLLKLIG
jgi:flagellin